jgi:hypothetical protein
MASNTTFVSGAILTAQQQNNFPFGVMGYSKRTAGNVSVSTTKADVTGASATFTAIAGRAYKVTYSCTVTKNTTVGIFSFFIADGSNTDYYSLLADIRSTGSGDVVTFSNVVTGLSAGTQTLKIRASVNNNTGTINADATLPTSFIIEDIGIA